MVLLHRVSAKWVALLLSRIPLYPPKIPCNVWYHHIVPASPPCLLSDKTMLVSVRVPHTPGKPLSPYI